MQYISGYTSPLGGITLASDGEALTGLWFDRQKHFGSTLAAGEPKDGLAVGNPADMLTAETREAGLWESAGWELPVFQETRCWLDIYFDGGVPGFTPACRLQGTPFRMAVWEILKEIPYGETMTYGEIAKRLAVQKGLVRMSAQAVGGAVGHNPIGIIVPCHRVVGGDGRLTGYAGGIGKKEKLLALERRERT